MSTEYQLTFSDYLSILRRRWVMMLGVFAAIFVVALAVAMVVPPVYQSTGTIMVESQQISSDLVQATVTSYADERIEVIKQRVMTRENLLRIIEKYQLFKDSRTNYTPSELIDEMRSSILIELVNANVQGKQRGAGTIAFKVSFEHRRPEMAHKVANELVTLFLDENVKVRTERATQTTEFLTQEADKLKADLEGLESQIATYKQENGGALPDNMMLSMNTMQRLESELRETEREYKAAQEELRFLDIELTSAKAGIGTTGPVAASALTPAQDLERSKAELARLSAVYTENHPDLKSLRRKIERLEAAQANVSTKAEPVASAGDLMVAKVEARIAAAKNRVASLGSQQNTLRARLNQMESQLLKAPQVERGLMTLERDHQNAKKKYEEIRAKQMTAQVAENLEGDKKAERFSLLEPPIQPDKPIKPNRKKMIAMGLILAIAGGLGSAMAMETIYAGVRGVDALEAIIHQRPLAVIPYITLDDEIARRQVLIKRALIATGVGILILLLVVHFAYMPLDILVMKILFRLG